MSTGYMDDDMLLDVDYSEAVDYDPVGAGRYPCRVVSVDGPWLWGATEESQFYANSGKPAKKQIQINCEIIDMPEYPNRMLTGFTGDLSGRYSGTTRKAVAVLNPAQDPLAPINVLELIGKTAVAVIEDRLRKDPGHEGEKVDNLKRFEPLV